MPFSNGCQKDLYPDGLWHDKYGTTCAHFDLFVLIIIHIFFYTARNIGITEGELEGGSQLSSVDINTMRQTNGHHFYSLFELC